jgi:hypothetical protein
MDDPTPEVLSNASGGPFPEDGTIDLEASSTIATGWPRSGKTMGPLVRKQAEFENFRKRTAREKEEIVQFAAMETIRGLCRCSTISNGA